jgi:sec-independent protein translocase protein TatA
MFDMILLLFGLGTTEIILIVLVVLLLFGGRKIPELMKGLGKGIKSFKEGVQGMGDETRESKKPESGTEKKDNPEEPAG